MADPMSNQQAQLWHTFQSEAREHLQAIQSSMLELEKSPRPEPRLRLLDTALRCAHSLKGAAAVVRLGTAVNICQTLETIFGRLKRGELQENADLFDTLQGAVDTVHDLVANRSEAGLPPEAVAIVRTLQKLAITDSINSSTSTKRLKRPRTVRLFRNRGESVMSESEAVPPKPENLEPGRTTAVKVAATAKATPALPVAAPPDRSAITTSLASHSVRRAQVGSTVRLDVEKLDELLRRVEELASGLRLDQQTYDESTGLLERTADRYHDLQNLGPMLHRLSTGETLRDDIQAVVHAVKELTAHAEFVQQQVRSQIQRQQANQQRLNGMVDALQIDMKRLLMLPFATLLTTFPRMVRDLARDLEKLAEFTVEGAGIEVSRQILDELRDPLVHMLRNAIDHGIEEPDARVAAGKPRLGQVALVIRRRPGDQVEIELSDDGQGIDIQHLKERAVEIGALDAARAATMTDAEALDLIFHSDVSTSESVSLVSGRGLGMSIVQEHLDNLGGTITVSTEKGVGTTYHIVLPSSLATTRALGVKVGGQTLLAPSLYIDRVLRVGPGDIRSHDDGSWIDVEGRSVALVDLATVFGLEPDMETRPVLLPVVVCRAGPVLLGVVVDEILSENDILVKPLGPVLSQLPYFAGAAVARWGTLTLVLNTVDLVQDWLTIATLDEPESIAPRRMRLLIVDDMRTMRQFLASILAEAGYDIVVAGDGEAAWQILRSEPVDLVICDVQMPVMDGLSLTRRLRRRFGALPAVVMLSSLESEDDLQAGMDAGCDAYLRKSELTDDLLLEIVAAHLPTGNG